MTCRRTDDGWTDNGTPCTADHCTARTHCGQHIGPTELTCARCISHTRDDLTLIATLADLMLNEATIRGVNSEAASLAGPAANPEAWAWRKATARQGGPWHASLIEDDDQHHPLFVTGMWEMMIRDDYGPATDQRVTVDAACDYLNTRLHRIAHDPSQDFAQLAAELTRCRAHLEAVLHDSRMPEMGAPCPVCTADEGRGPRLVKHYVDADTTGASDEWRCPACGSVWREADYRLRVSAVYVQHAEALTADQIRAEYRINPATLRRWANGWTNGSGIRYAPCVKKRGKDPAGRQLYDVADALTARDTTQQVIP